MNFFTSIGLARTLSLALGPVMKFLFGLPGASAIAFVLGSISGYPIGAVATAELYQNGHITKKDAEKMLAFCNNSGPLFVIGCVGICLLGSRTSGIILYVSHIISAILVGIIFKILKSKNSASPLVLESCKTPKEAVSHFIVSITNSIETLAKICGIITIFAVFTSFIPVIPNAKILNLSISAILEITKGLFEISQFPFDYHLKLAIMSLVLSFSGICILLQVLSVIKNTDLSIAPYFFGKLIQGFISFFLTRIFVNFIPSKHEICSKITSNVTSNFYILNSVPRHCTTCLLLAIFATIFVYIGAKKQINNCRYKSS